MGAKLEKEENVAQKINKKLVEAAERGETERVRELLRMEGVDVHHAVGRVWAWNKTPLLAACVGGHLETARVILEYGGETQKELEDAFLAAAKGSVRDNSAVGVAAQFGRCEVLEVLLRDPRVDP